MAKNKMTDGCRYAWAELLTGKMCDIVHALGYQVKVTSVDGEERVAYLKNSSNKPNMKRVAELASEVDTAAMMLKVEARK